MTLNEIIVTFIYKYGFIDDYSTYMHMFTYTYKYTHTYFLGT